MFDGLLGDLRHMVCKTDAFLNSAPCSDAPGFGFQRLQQDLHDSA